MHQLLDLSIPETSRGNLVSIQLIRVVNDESGSPRDKTEK